MFYLRTLVSLAVLLVLIFLVVPSKAHAYIDPGSGSFLLQLLIASLFAASFAIKTWWRNIKNAVTKFFKKNYKDESDVH